MNHKQLGLLRLVDFPTKEGIEKELSLSFADPYDAIGDVKDLARGLETELDRILVWIACRSFGAFPRLSPPAR